MTALVICAARREFCGDRNPAGLEFCNAHREHDCMEHWYRKGTDCRKGAFCPVVMAETRCEEVKPERMT